MELGGEAVREPVCTRDKCQARDSEAGYRLTKTRESHRVCVRVCMCAHAPVDLGASSLWGSGLQGLLCPGASNWREQKILQPVTRQMECLRAAAGGICIISMYAFLAHRLSS